MSSEHSCDGTGSAMDWMAYMANFSHSLQRIEGHYAAMEQRTSAILSRVNDVESQVSPLVKKQDEMDSRLSQLLDRVTAVEQSQGCRHRGSVDGGELVPTSRHFAGASSGGGWMCPICRSGILMPALSLKGHIRRLLPGNSQSSRPKCRWKANDPLHEALVARFEGATFQDRCNAFIRVFYAFLQAATSSSRTPSETSDLITSWLAAVLNGHTLPVLPHCSSSSGSRRRLLSSDTPYSST